MNIVFAALTMAFGVSAVVTNITRMIDAGGVILSSSVYLLLGGAAFVIGIRWIRESAGILSDVSDLRKETRAIKASGNDEEILRLMIGMMGIYRDRRTTVQRMILISKVGGAVFLALGVWNLVTALGSAANPFVLNGGSSRQP